MGITDPVESTDKEILETFNEELKYIDSCYEVALPWKTYPPELPCNYGLSLGRLKSDLTTLHQKPEFLTKYDDIIQEQLQLGIIEDEPPEKLI